MSQDWIVDVLADLKSFARQNGLVSLAAQLDDTMMVAAAELAQSASSDIAVLDPDAQRDADIHRGLAGRELT